MKMYTDWFELWLTPGRSPLGSLGPAGLLELCLLGPEAYMPTLTERV